MDQTTICPDCGARVAGDARVCDCCGTALSATAALAPIADPGSPRLATIAPPPGPAAVVVRLPDGVHPGLIVAETHPLPFRIDDSWRTDSAPAPNTRAQPGRDAEGKVNTIGKRIKRHADSFLIALTLLGVGAALCLLDLGLHVLQRGAH